MTDTDKIFKHLDDAMNSIRSAALCGPDDDVERELHDIADQIGKILGELAVKQGGAQ